MKGFLSRFPKWAKTLYRVIIAYKSVKEEEPIGYEAGYPGLKRNENKHNNPNITLK